MFKLAEQLVDGPNGIEVIIQATDRNLWMKTFQSSHRRGSFKHILTLMLVVIAFCPAALAVAQNQEKFKETGKVYQASIQPLVAKYCLECHAGEKAKGDIDLAAFNSLADVRKDPLLWQKVREMLDSRQMPPKKAKQPTDDEQSRMRTWVRQYLQIEAETHAGDPGNVVLRRLSNDEYTYTIRDLTGISSLDPAREFPVDGAAGEGFTNTGVALVMSPSLVRKYLDAGKVVAEHAVFLPDGIRFSPYASQRDRTDDLLAQIQAFYRRYTSDSGGSAVNLHGIRFDTNQGGRLPLVRYITATLAERKALRLGTTTVAAVARERSLNEKYLGTLWSTLSADADLNSSLLVDAVRSRWRSAKVGDAPAITAEIEERQRALWKFNSIGHIGRKGGAKSWMEPITPIATRQDFKMKLSKPDRDGVVSLYLVAGDAGDGNEQDDVIWHQPRIQLKNGTTIALRDVRSMARGIENSMAKELARTSEYLLAVSQIHGSEKSIAELASGRKLDKRLLGKWVASVALTRRHQPKIAGQFTKKIVRGRGFEAINGWGDMPSLLTNSSDKPISFLTLTVPARGVTVHPSPSQESIVAWVSPINGRVSFRGKVADADNKCGNGAAWRVELASAAGAAELAKGVYDNGGSQAFEPKDSVDVRKGDIISLIVSARDRNHVCDTTHVELAITEVDGEKKTWSLANDVVDHVLKGNPLADRYGNNGVWHFCASGNKAAVPKETVPPGSILARWRAAVIEKKSVDSLAKLAGDVQAVLTTPDSKTLSAPDQLLRRRWTDWSGPLDWAKTESAAGASDSKRDADGAIGLDAKQFGKHPNSGSVDPASLCVRAPSIIEVRLPASLIDGAEFVTAATLHQMTGKDGSVQVQVLTAKPDSSSRSLSAPILTNNNSIARQRVKSSMDAFRNLFPPALCYARIVPVDEVVTLTLFYREDHLLRKLMLDDQLAAELDRLWDELFYVSHEPLKLVTAFEQISEFATQDAPQLVIALKPMRQGILGRAEAFRARMIDAEPAQLKALLQIADRAWRRKLSETEQQDLRELYRQLRDDEVPHEEAMKLLLARVLTSPNFLYRREAAVAGEKAVPITDHELANRLSYFLWSSMPDARLRDLAAAGRLKDNDTLVAETRRMLAHARTRRLAIQFACQWLHVRNFDQNDEKNEKLYPQFATLRSDMNEETIRFFDDLFRNNGSILDFIDGDHAFLNESLAKHYGIVGVKGPQWRRVDGVRKNGRGGVLGMASVLASQSGASRTSPILRGNWVSETLLGERLPRPPANVPVLPEIVPTGLTTRQLIERHTSDAACAKCHARIDPFGFSLEQYDAIGRVRPKTVDTKTTLFDGRSIEGIEGLRTYLSGSRRSDVVRQFCRKLLGFSLGRSVQLSDEPLLAKMMRDLEAGGYRFHIAVESIIRSKQFRFKRGKDWSQVE